MPESPRVQVRPSTAFGGSWFWWCDVCSGGGWKSSCAAAGDAGRRHLATHLTEHGRRLASERDDLIARGVDPSALVTPVAPLIGGHPCTPTGP